MLSVKEKSSSNQIEKTLLKNIFSNLFSDPYTVKFWDGEELTYGSGEDKFRILLNEPLPFSEVITDPSIAFGEAYMHKKLEIEGSIQAVVESLYRNSKSFLRDKEKYSKLLNPIKNSLRKSKENISYH